jgi:hypothetical protein
VVRGSNAGGGEIFRIRLDWPCGPPRFLYNGYRVSSLVVKRPWRGINHPPPRPHLAPRLKKVYSYTSTPSLRFHGLFHHQGVKTFSRLFMWNASSPIWNRRRIQRYWFDPSYWRVWHAQERYAQSEFHSSVLNASQLAWEHRARPVSCSACRVTLQVNMWHRGKQIPLTAEARRRPHETVISGAAGLWRYVTSEETSLPQVCLDDILHWQLQSV